MTGAVCLGNVTIIARALVRVLNHQGDGSPCGLPFKHTGENTDLIGLLTLRGKGGLPRRLRPEKAEYQPHSTQCVADSVNDAADRRAMAFAPRGNPEHMPESIVGHGGF